MSKDNKFQLMDGTVLVGIPRTGGTVDWPSAPVQCAEMELFVKNAHFLLSSPERIFADSKLFLAPVRIRSGMAYCGNFSMPCLGGYLEWWLNFKGASSKGEGSERELVYCISGSPLSGHNVSRGVRKDGSTCPCAPGSVLMMAHTFCDVIRRYRKPMQHFESYSLSEALAVLKGGRPTFEDSLHKIVLDQRVQSQEREIDELKKTVERQGAWIQEYVKALARAVVREHPEAVRKAIDEADAERRNK